MNASRVHRLKCRKSEDLWLCGKILLWCIKWIIYDMCNDADVGQPSGKSHQLETWTMIK